MTAETAAVLLAACRWVTYIAVLCLVGVTGARWVLRHPRSSALSAVHATFDDRVFRSAVWIALLWIPALLATLAVNVVIWFGPAGLTDRDKLAAMLFQTNWGQAWTYTFAAAIAAWLMVSAGRRWPDARGLAAPLAGAAAVLPTPLIGHAAGYGPLVWALHAAHLAGAGLWLGTLFLVARHTWPLWHHGSIAPGALPDLLRAITPLALTGAAMAVGSGIGLAGIHVWPPQSIFDTPYGTTLAMKVAVIGAIVGFGWLNWRRFGPAASDEAVPRRRLRRSVAAELTLSFGLVLVLTAWLSGLPTPE